MRLSGALHVPSIDLRLQGIALGQQRAVARGKLGQKRRESLPKGQCIAPQWRQHIGFKKTRQPGIDRDTGAGSTSIDPEAVASQVQNVMSKDLALKIIREMELYKREEYDPVQKGLGISGQVLVMLGLQKDPRTIPQEERVLEMYYKRLLVYPLGKSRVMAIEFQSEDPKVAANVANRIAEEYLLREEGAKNQTSRVTSEWLDKAIAPLMKKVQEAEAKVEAFRASKGLFVSSNNTTISTQQLSELNTQFSLVRSQQADLQARAKVIRDDYRMALMVGVLGGFTTFSSFGWETFSLLNTGHRWRPVANLLLSNGLGLLAVWAGYRLAERLHGG
jgi:fluoride ion exporter CrcB/FEX